MIQGKLNESTVIAAQYLSIRKYFFLAAFLLILLTLLGTGYLVVATCVAFLVILFISVPFHGKRAFRQYKALSEHTIVEVRPEGVFFKRTNGEGLLPWDEIHKWKKNDTLLLLYPSNYAHYLIPAYFFENREGFDAFCKLVESKAPQKNGFLDRLFR